MRRQRALLVFDRKVFLVVAHYSDENFLRQRQVFGTGSSPPGSVGHSVRWVTSSTRASSSRQRASGKVRVAASSALRMRWRRAATSATTKAAAEGCQVVGRARNGNGAISLEDAMAIAEIGGADPRELQRNHASVRANKSASGAGGRIVPAYWAANTWSWARRARLFPGEVSRPELFQRSAPAAARWQRRGFTLGQGRSFRAP